ncbi:OLC1v1007803C1 [Oldenlandia corymbosa var. corymbosa]|uniref:OLC1v1007803C1 n=1 Tax=Oldenlandia corymbosa var. corymbosa TaxID=529605 RepID=A0AAV1DNA2_OLDCO|nr:OLC1v1007803C1 [Oldenlandia corymbosa var. corymbosa]
MNTIHIGIATCAVELNYIGMFANYILVSSSGNLLAFRSHTGLLKTIIIPISSCDTTTFLFAPRKRFGLCVSHSPLASFIRRFSSSNAHLSPTLSPEKNVVDILEERGLLEALTGDSLRDKASTCSLRVYCGFDPTADSLHLRNLLGIIVLTWFVRLRHQVVVLIGGATGRVGDPSGKSTERPELDIETLENNIAGISATIRNILGRAAAGNEGSSKKMLLF